MYKVEFITGDHIIEGFDYISIVKSISAIANSFYLRTDKAKTSELMAVKSHLKAGNEYIIKVDGKVDLTGYIDDIDYIYEGSSKVLDIFGRSKAGDLVDCFSVARCFENRKMSDIIKELVLPYAIKVVVSADEKVFSFSTMTGESIAEAIARLCQITNKLVISHVDGSLEITSRKLAQPINVAFKTGKAGNVIKARKGVSASSSFSKYTVLGQHRLDDTLSLEACTAPVKEMITNDIDRFRHKVIFSEDANEKAIEKSRQKDIKKSEIINLTTSSWKDVDGNIFRNNTLINADESWLDLDGSYLINTVNLVKSPKRGTVTDFVLEAIS